MKRVVLGVLATVLSLLVAPSALAAPLPDVGFDVTDVRLIVQSHAVEVTASVQCTGEATMRWFVVGTQGNVKARASRRLPCDGVLRGTGLNLISEDGRFHGGPLELTSGYTVRLSGGLSETVTVDETLRLQPSCPSCGRS